MRNIAMDKETMKGSGDADRSFRPAPPMCECGRRHVHQVGFKCFVCRKEQKEGVITTRTKTK